MAISQRCSQKNGITRSNIMPAVEPAEEVSRPDSLSFEGSSLFAAVQSGFGGGQDRPLRSLGSLALRADAVYSLVDVLASVALLLGLKISERKSQSFPLGLYKVENLASIAISFLLFVTAYEILMEAMRGEVAPASCQGSALFAVAAVVPLPSIRQLSDSDRESTTARPALSPMASA